ncbi:hypothetical protein ACQY0O_007576 [Thecaphora frezii]
MLAGVTAASRATRLLTTATATASASTATAARSHDLGRVAKPLQSLDSLRNSILHHDGASTSAASIASTSQSPSAPAAPASSTLAPTAAPAALSEASSSLAPAASAPPSQPTSASHSKLATSSSSTSLPAATTDTDTATATATATATITTIADAVTAPTRAVSATSSGSKLDHDAKRKEYRNVPLELRPLGCRDEAEESLQRAVTSVIQAYSRSGRPHEATAFASRVLKLPNFLPAKIRLPEPARNVAAELPPISVSTLHYMALLECAARKRSVKAARSILLDLLSRDLPINGRVRRGLSRLIFSSVDQDSSHMVRMFRRILPKFEWRQDQSPAQETQRDVTNRRLSKFAELLDSLGLMDRIILNKAARLSKVAQSVHEDESDRKAMHRWMVDDASQPFPEPPPAHLAPLEEMMDLSKPLHPAAYAMRMRVFAVVRRDFDSAQKLWRSMLEHGVRPNVLHIAPLVEGLVAALRFEDAQRLKVNAQRMHGIAPSLRIHTALIRGYAKNGDGRRLKRELDELRRNGYEPDETILQIVEAAESKRRPSAMTNRSVDLLDVHSVSSRFQVQMRARVYLAAQQLVSSALENGLRADNLLHSQVKRSVNWLRKRLCEAKGEAPAATAAAASTSAATMTTVATDELEAALKLARQNLGRIQSARLGIVAHEKQTMRQFRRAVVELILAMADGTLKQQARQMALDRSNASKRGKAQRRKKEKYSKRSKG